MVTDAEFREFLNGAYGTFLQELFDYIDENAKLQGVSQERVFIQLRNTIGNELAEEWRFHSGYGH